MEWYMAMILLLGTVCLGMFLGLPVAFAFFAANFLGTYLFLGGDIGLESMPKEFHLAVAKFILTPIALFLLMGEILLHTGVAFKAIGAIDRLITRIPGRLSVVAIVGGTVFSSLSGSTIANTAILGSVLLPDMLKRGYKPVIAVGPIMAVGGIAMLIPPSALAVLLASLAEQSIGKLLIAGIVPGMLMAFLFFAYVVGRCAMNPDLAPAADTDDSHLDQPLTLTVNRRGRPIFTTSYNGPRRRLWNRILPSALYILPLFVIFVVVVGSIFFKLAAPTEAAALGCLAATGACYFFRIFNKTIVISGIEGADFGWREMWKAMMETAKINTMILFIITGSLVFAQALAASGATNGLLELLVAMDMTVMTGMVLMMLVLLFLGAFMDQVSMLLLTLPFFMPLAQSLGIDMLWLMVLMLIVMEISLLTPPFGLLLYVMKGVAPPHINLGTIVYSALPFIVIELFVLALLIWLPELATWLPEKID
ncbi:MAG: TRAP transporter large permease [Rhodospirillaceae bacterium]|nr:TRAP transporter large permease [Rhodospirillaceae bacterium]MBT4486528.1 TRAP transporter large permease [Rhodospirillaceae bacterium]MBT5193204.1 TRAP transporter large permease [Rhodospirillaceae bacterium]MBT5897405.1 TRAP transporter large permease [Rhodospirillaceae bacterium]